jgi:hypothetical protein
MTLILSLISPAHSILVADRRYTVNGRLVDDERTKASVVFCRDARVAVAFTGVAKAGTFETSRALLRLLSQAAQPDHLLRMAIGRFALLLTEEVRKLNLKPAVRHLTVVFAGFFYYAEVPQPFLCQVTNIADKSGAFQKDALDRFLIWTARQPLGLYGFGARAGVALKDRVTLRGLLSEGKPGTALVGKAVDAIQQAADSPRSRGLVGKQCNSLTLAADVQAPALAHYHSATLANKMYMPSVVVSTPSASFTNYGGSIEQWDSAGGLYPLVVPKVGRNQPCPCGSGRKYKNAMAREAHESARGVGAATDLAPWYAPCMKLLGGKWSRGDLLALLGVIAAVLAIPGMPKIFYLGF